MTEVNRCAKGRLIVVAAGTFVSNGLPTVLVSSQISAIESSTVFFDDHFEESMIVAP
jgi:hypothetical protein